MTHKINGFLKISVRILLLAMAFCLPVSAQAMQMLVSRFARPAARAAKIGTQITGRTFSSLIPAKQASGRAGLNLGKAAIAAAGLAGTVGANQVLAQEEPETQRESLDEMYKRQVDQQDKLALLERESESLREAAKTQGDWAAVDRLEEEIRALSWNTNVDLPKMIGERAKELKELKIVVEKIVARKEAEQVPFEKVQSMLFGQQALCKEIYPLQQQNNVLRSKIDQLMKESNKLRRSGQEDSARDREIGQELLDLWDQEYKLGRRIHELKKESKKGTIWEYEQVAINGVKTVAFLGSVVAAVNLAGYLDTLRVRSLAGEAYLAGGRYVLDLQEARIAQAGQLAQAEQLAQADQLANEAIRRQADSIWNSGFSAGLNSGFSAGVTHAIQRFLGPPPAEPTARTLQNPPASHGP